MVVKHLVAGSAALLLLLGTAPSVAAPSPVPTVTVRPSDLPVGEPLRVAVLDGRSGTVHLPTGVSVTIDDPAGDWYPDTLLEVAGGYLVSARRGARTVVVTDDGDVRELPRRPYEPVMVATDGRTFLGERTAHLPGRRGYRDLRRFRVSDGRPVGRPLVVPATLDSTVPLVMTRHRVLVTALRKPFPSQDLRTRWWNTRTGTSRPLIGAAPRQFADTLGRVASVRGGIATSDLERRQSVVDLRTGRTLWKVGAPGRGWGREAGVAVSPNGAHLLTVDDAGTMAGYGADFVRRLRVHDARTGTALADFSGFFDTVEDGPPNPKLTWETSDSFVAVAHDDFADGGGSGSFTGTVAVVRCRVSTGACESVPLPSVTTTYFLSLATRASS